MRHSLALYLHLCLLLLLLTACGGTPAPPPAAGQGLYLLTEVSGQLQHKRPSWKDYLPLSFGTTLDRDDLLQAAPDGRGKVVCADLTVVPVPPGYVGGLPCPQASPVLMRGDSLVVGPRRGAPATADVPYLLSPRHTFLLDAHPLLRWNPTAGPYTVHVRGGTLDWQAQASAAELRYPDNAPALQPGVPYALTVEDANGRASTEEKLALDPSFVVLAPTEAQSALSLLDQAGGAGLDDRARLLLEAEIMAGRGLRAEALARLAQLDPTGELPAVQRRLGDLSLEVGLYTEAQAAFGRARTGFRALGDPAGEAAALVGQGLAQHGNGDDAAARAALEQGRALYQEIGDGEGVIRIDELLAGIK